MKTKTDKHIFSFYVSQLTDVLANKRIGDTLQMADAACAHRVFGIVRLAAGDTCTLFDQQQHVQITLDATSTKKRLVGTITQVAPNTVHTPHITLFLPVLKRDAFEQALYAAVELGANTVQLITTQKVQRAWGGTKEFERLQRIMIAAAEQSGNYALPALHKPVGFDQALKNLCTHKIFFDVGGQSLFDTAQVLRAEQPKKLCVLVGPEGDLTAQEKAALKEHGFQFVRLTPTVLRSFQAVVVGLGALRSI